MRFLAAVLIFMFAPALLWAEEAIKLKEVVVTASKLEEPLSETTSHTVVVGQGEIERSNADDVTEVLRGVSDLNLVQAGGVGKAADIILRGGSPNQTLVMIDGVKVKSTTTGQFDFSGIMLRDIERVEIVKGPQSTLYGSEAMAGVVNMITKKGEGDPHLEFSYVRGAHDTQSPSVSFSGGSEDFNYRLSAAYLDTDGISVFKDGHETDAYKNGTFSGKIGTRPSDVVSFEITARYYYTRSELDSIGSDDPNFVQYGRHYLVSAKADAAVSDEWQQTLTVSTYEEALKMRDPDTSFNEADINSAIYTVDWQNNVLVENPLSFVGGVEYRREEGENKGVFDEELDNKAVYLSSRYRVEGNVINAGLRYDDHETFGSETTYRVAVLQDMGAGLKARGSYATGFRAPTFNELFYKDAWSTGNPDIKPETSRSWEVGLEHIQEGSTGYVTYFYQKYTDLIQWGVGTAGLWTPENISEAVVKGWETGFSVAASEHVGLRGAYTYLDTEDKATGQRLSRRPIDKLSLGLALSWSKLDAGVNYLYVGKRFDSAAGRNLDPYYTVGLSGTFRVGSRLSLFARVDNLLDEDYEEAGGFSTDGTALYGGIKATF